MILFESANKTRKIAETNELPMIQGVRRPYFTGHMGHGTKDNVCNG